ncbi:MAG TPA: hypothetical protein VMS55_17015 [Myxococcota bacterium]|nr:hypothetical protein [Myxococcota bacterium]
MRHATRRLRHARASALALGLLALAAVAGADPPPGVPLAPPGDCAQPRTPQGASLSTDKFEIAGSPIHHFTPGDVAVGPGAAFTPPDAPTFTRGPCDAPNPGCRTILDRPPIAIDEPPPGSGSTPGGK